MEQSRKQEISRISEVMKTADIFPLELGFTHDNKRTYKSVSSGILSILTLTCIISYFLYLAADIWNFKVSLKNSLRKRDLVFDNTTFDLAEHNFDFAVNLQYFGADKSRAGRLHQYISVNVNPVKAYWKEVDNAAKLFVELDTIDLEKCTYDSFNNDTKYLDKLGIVGNYYCPTKKNFTLQGDFSSDSLQFVSISIRECNQTRLDIQHPGEVCAPLADQQETVSQMMFSYVFTNQYFSGENKEEPIQQDYKLLTLGVPYQQSFFTLAKLSVSYAMLEDSWLFQSYNARNVSYSTFRIDSQYGRAQIPYHVNTPYMTVNLMIDENVYINERTAFNFVAALQSLGGFASVMMVFAKVVSSFTQQFSYLQEVISRVYCQDFLSSQINFDTNQEKAKTKVGQPHSQLQTYRAFKQFDYSHLDKDGFDLEGNQEQINRLINQVQDDNFKDRPKRIHICNYVFSRCGSPAKKTQIFNRGRDLLQSELNIEEFLKKIRLIELFIELKLNPFQKTILKTITQKRSFTAKGPKDDPLDPDISLENCKLSAQSFKTSLQSLIEATSGEKVAQFDKSLATYLGLHSEKESEEKKRKKRHKKNAEKVDQQKSAQVSFKPMTAGLTKGLFKGRKKHAHPKLIDYDREESKQDASQVDDSSSS